MEVKAHNSTLGGEGVLWPRWVLDSVAADQTSLLLQEIIRTISNSEEILVFRVPLNGSGVSLSGLLGGKTPEWEH
jgi:hypothetical protein